MADSPWIAETETGRWYLWGTGPNGESVRRYSTEVDTSASYQPRDERAYQQDYRRPSQSAREVYDDGPSYSSGAIGRQPPEVPRTYLSSRNNSQPQYTTTYTTGGQSQNEADSGSSRRRERDQRYHSSGGYNPPAATYQNVASSSRAPASDYQATYDLASNAAKLNINDYGGGPGYRLSHSPQQPQWPATTAPPGRGHGLQYQNTPAPAPRELSRSRLVLPTLGETEQLDSSFRMRNTDWKKFFECGRVFKTLWTDPAGPDDASENSQFMSKAKYKVAHGQYVYSKIRRFVVVSRHNNSCQCLPVTTYDGKGYRKRGIKLEEHGLIYTSSQAPLPVPGISMQPLYIKDAAEELKISYINYGRSYCVDTNVKVKNVGVLDGPSRRLLKGYYQAIHFPSDDEPPPPPSGSRRTREDDLAGMGEGLRLPPQSSSASDYPTMRSQYDERYREEIPAATSRPLSGPVDPQYRDVVYQPEYVTTSRPAQERTYSTSSSSRPPIVQYRRDSEIDLDGDLPPVRRRRESNAGADRRRR